MAKNAANAATDDAPKSFEAALAELEKIVQSMEAGTLPLEQSLAAHKRGIELATLLPGAARPGAGAGARARGRSAEGPRR